MTGNQNMYSHIAIHAYRFTSTHFQVCMSTPHTLVCIRIPVRTNTHTHVYPWSCMHIHARHTHSQPGLCRCTMYTSFITSQCLPHRRIYRLLERIERCSSAYPDGRVHRCAARLVAEGEGRYLKVRSLTVRAANANTRTQVLSYGRHQQEMV
jgi:hypothetical protein